MLRQIHMYSMLYAQNVLCLYTHFYENQCNVFTYIFQSYFSDSRAIVWLPVLPMKNNKIFRYLTTLNENTECVGPFY